MQPGDLLTQAYAFLLVHAWWALAALVIGGLVRLAKSDVPLPVTIPPKYRAFAALGLGVASGILQAIATGTPWATALLQGLSAAATAIVGHETLVEGIRKGREFFSPTPKAPAPPSSPFRVAPPADSPTPTLPSLMRSILIAVFVAAIPPAIIFGCSSTSIPAKTVEDIGLDLEQIACVVAQDELGTKEPALLATACAIPPAQIETVINLLGATKKARLAVVIPDGGTVKAVH